MRESCVWHRHVERKAATATTYHLVGEHQHRLEPKFAVAKVEQIFEGWSQEIQNHHVEVSLDAIPADVWDPSCGACVQRGQ